MHNWQSIDPTFLDLFLYVAYIEKITCKRCGNKDVDVLRRGKFSQDVVFYPSCDDICNIFRHVFLSIVYDNAVNYRKLC